MTEDLKNPLAHEGREVVYSCLSHLYMDTPDGKTYEMLKVLSDGMSDMEGYSEETVQGLQGIKDFLLKREQIPESERAEFDLNILRGYTQIFCLTKSVPTSESYYTSVDKIVMQESRDDALRLYKSAGFSMDIDSNEPEDYISSELMFMSYLSMAAKKACLASNWERLENVLEFQRKFIETHLFTWLDKFAAGIAEYSCAERLYDFIAKLTVGYVKDDRAFLDN
ncbi:MAG: molecular chaperone TorD family protein [Deferribacterales bacterium]|nr:molecular chaperone TorD family protein [Deferribacterales bacterium]